MDMLNWFLDTSMGGPGWRGLWPTWLMVIYHGSNLVMTVIDFSVPFLILRAWGVRRDGVNPRRFWMTAAFLPCMGMTRFVRVVELWGAPYHLTTIIDCIGALCAVMSVLTLPGFLKEILLLPSRQQLQDLADALHAEKLNAEAERLTTLARYDELSVQVRLIEGKLENQGWTAEKAAALREIQLLLAATIEPTIQGIVRNGHSNKGD